MTKTIFGGKVARTTSGMGLRRTTDAALAVIIAIARWYRSEWTPVSLGIEAGDDFSKGSSVR